MQHVNFQGNPYYQATKQHLNNNEMVKNKKWDGVLINLSFFGWAISSAWKNVGIISGLALCLIFHCFSQFNCCLSVVL